MISGKHSLEDLAGAKEAVKDANPIWKAVVKLLGAILKVLLSVRTNQVKIMDKLGVEKVTTTKDDKVTEPGNKDVVDPKTES